jgi:hypothetical protein
MKRLANQLVGDVWPVAVARVEVVHAGRDGLAEPKRRVDSKRLPRSTSWMGWCRGSIV